ncbi:MAG: hypothetical protein IT306_14080 [Chloroflexi bacterium]|nr:hypothetical protein [Chloroflexota bacterium]
MTANPLPPQPGFARWDADDALDALHRAGLDIDRVEQARWPAAAPQPRTQRQAFTFRSRGAVDPHLLLVFDSAEALEAWRLWLARYWKARPYLSIHDNLLLLVSRDLPDWDAARFHDALARMRATAALAASAAAAVPPAPPLETPQQAVAHPAQAADTSAAPGSAPGRLPPAQGPE